MLKNIIHSVTESPSKKNEDNQAMDMFVTGLEMLNPVKDPITWI